jgi:hypothetical protein
MPPLPVITNTYRVTLDWGLVGGTNPRNVMHFRDTTGGNDAADLFAVLDASATSHMWNPMQSSQHCGQLHITPLDGTSPTVSFNTTGAGWSGEAAGEFCPSVAQVISMKTAVRGRSYRGRVFLGPCCEDTIENGFRASGTGFTNQIAAWPAFHTAVTATPWEPVVASYKLGTAETVTAYLVERTLATQRRRQTRLR